MPALGSSLQKISNCSDWPKTMAYVGVLALQLHEREHSAPISQAAARDCWRVACGASGKAEEHPPRSLVEMNFVSGRKSERNTLPVADSTSC